MSWLCLVLLLMTTVTGTKHSGTHHAIGNGFYLTLYYYGDDSTLEQHSFVYEKKNIVTDTNTQARIECIFSLNAWIVLILDSLKSRDF